MKRKPVPDLSEPPYILSHLTACLADTSICLRTGATLNSASSNLFADRDDWFVKFPSLGPGIADQIGVNILGDKPGASPSWLSHDHDRHF